MAAETITWTKLRSGEWGLRGPASALTPGYAVLVSKRDGSVTQATVGRVIWTGGGVALATVESDRPRVSGRRGGGYGRGHTCTDRCTGHYCRQCGGDDAYAVNGDWSCTYYDEMV